MVLRFDATAISSANYLLVQTSNYLLTNYYWKQLTVSKTKNVWSVDVCIDLIIKRVSPFLWRDLDHVWDEPSWKEHFTKGWEVVCKWTEWTSVWSGFLYWNDWGRHVFIKQSIHSTKATPVGWVGGWTWNFNHLVHVILLPLERGLKYPLAHGYFGDRTIRVKS